MTGRSCLGHTVLWQILLYNVYILDELVGNTLNVCFLHQAVYVREMSDARLFSPCPAPCPTIDDYNSEGEENLTHSSRKESQDGKYKQIKNKFEV